MDYSDEPPHSEHLFVQGTEPFNAEAKASALVEFPITPEDLIYCRNHGPVKEIDHDQHSIIINGGVERYLKLSLLDLHTRFENVQIVAALQVCYFIFLCDTNGSYLSVCRKPT